MFNIQPLNRFAGKAAAIKRPREIACFSYDENHQLHLDASSLKYYYPPRLPADLSAGYENFRNVEAAKPPDEHLIALLATIKNLEEKEGKKLEVDIVTWRGMMTKIMTAPFDRFNSCEMNATLYDGTIFIEEDRQTRVENEESQKRNLRHGVQPASFEMMSYWGYKFETLCVIPDTWDNVSREQIENRPNEQVSNYAQYCSVVRTGMGGTSLILGGEVDAIWDQKPDDPDAPINWVELKTNEEPYDQRSLEKFHRKLLKHWAQSFLLGVPKIIVGFRRRNILQHLEEIDVMSMPGKSKQFSQPGEWDGNTCINFAAAFLEFLKKTITSEGTWRISRKERDGTITVYKTSDKGHGDILSPEFVAWRQTLHAQEAAKMLA
ncbi:rai1 protein [Rhizodiscina lignyota]|uniref:Decapping nuclease n=1 Tax=Rhizodiscina lignyota TaxID=1504668 RepID=A0A9P4M6W6_9PEZI|nr:rai1 protein [Rhizodiscina lignyota]